MCKEMLLVRCQHAPGTLPSASQSMLRAVRYTCAYPAWMRFSGSGVSFCTAKGIEIFRNPWYDKHTFEHMFYNSVA